MKWMTPSEVADVFGVDPKTVTRWAANGKLPYMSTPGGHRRFHPEVIEQYQKDNHVIIDEDGEEIRVVLRDAS